MLGVVVGSPPSRVCGPSEHNPKGQSFHQSRRAKDHLQKGARAQGILLQLDHQL